MRVLPAYYKLKYEFFQTNFYYNLILVLNSYNDYFYEIIIIRINTIFMINIILFVKFKHF